MKKITLFAIFVFLATFLYAAGPKGVRKEQVAGAKVKKNVTKLLKTIHWIKDFEELKQEAQKRKKMIFWVQMVGDLYGGL